MRRRFWAARIRGGGGGAALAALTLVAGCYTYVPLTTPEPAPGAKVSLVLSDQGRYEAASQIGASTLRVQGSVLQSTPADYVLQVSDVVDVRGARSKWMGETVPVRRSYVLSTYERRFSRPRTLFLAAGVASAFFAVVLSQNLFGFAGGSEGTPPPGDPNGQ